jgi:DNA-directed RNA polymerase subunit RPC12/RpoP
MSVSVYSCINCGGAVVFDIASSSFKCSRCSSTFTLEEMNKTFPDDEQGSLWNKAKEVGDDKETKVSDISNADEKDISVAAYTCHLCGAELMADGDTLAAAFCPYCKTPVTVSEKLLSGKSMPSRVLPFKITRDEAFEVFRNKTKGKPLLPRVFRSRVAYNDLKSVYVPFRLFDANCSASITANCRNVTRWEDRDYVYEKVDTYEARRSGEMAFGKVPHDVSDKIDDEAMREIEPFEISELTPFSKKYLAGHYAEAPTTREENTSEALRRRLRPAAEFTLLSTVQGYGSVSLSSSNFAVDKALSEYVMFPVWMFTAKFKNKDYLFAINGQNGTMSGRLPVDWSRAFFLFLELALISFIVAFIGLEIYLWAS